MDKKTLKNYIKEYKTGNLKNGYEIGKYFYDLKKYKKAHVYFEGYKKSKDYLYSKNVNKMLAEMYYNGYGCEADVKKALSLYDDFYYNDINVCKFLAETYYYGRKVEQDREKAHKYYAKLAEKKDLDAINKCIEYCKERNKYSLYTFYKMLYELNGDIEAKIFISTARFYITNETRGNIEDIHKMLLELEGRNDKRVYYALGRIYFDGLLGKANKKKAYDYFVKADKLGSIEAHGYLGDYYYEGIVVPKNVELAVKYYELAKNECYHAKYKLGIHKFENPYMGRANDISEGYNLINDCKHFPEAVCYLAKIVRENLYKPYYIFDREYYVNNAVKAGCDLAYVERGYLHLEKKKYVEAFKDFKYAYDKGVKEANYPLSICYKEGYGVEKNLEFAAELVEDSNDTSVLYEKAKQLIKDKKQADGIEILKKIINKSNDAKYDLAKYYCDGKYITKNETLAYEYFSQLSKVKHEAKLKTLRMLYFGQGVKQNKKGAVNSLKNEKSLDAECNYILGLEYENGTILTKSLTKALEYYEKAASKKYAKAKEKVDLIKTILEEERKKEEEKKKKEEELRLQQEILKKLQEERLNTLYQKYKNIPMRIPNLKFPDDFYKINLSYIITIYGELNISYELKYIDKIAQIEVTGAVRMVGYVCKERLDLFYEAIIKYVRKYIDEFCEEHPDYEFGVNTRFNYVCRYEQ